MTDLNPLPVAVIGAGPVGLAAAARLIERNLRPVIFEKGAHVGAAIAEWGHVRVFSPWRFNIDAAAGTMLDAAGWTRPEADYLPTGAEIVCDYLEPLAALPDIASALHTGARVEAVARQDRSRIGSDGRSDVPFVVVWRDAQGQQHRTLARVVIDASGTWGQPNPIGLEGLPVPGEAENADRIAYGIPDVKGADRTTYAGKHTLVIGAGHSAINAALDLLDLQSEAPGTRITWATRSGGIARLLGGGLNDELPGRGQLGLAAAAAIRSGRLALLSPLAVRRIDQTDTGLSIDAEQDGKTLHLAVDRIIVATGFRPDLAPLRELRLTLDPIVEAPTALARLIDRMEALAPAVESTSLVVSWFGSDLRCAACEIRPKVEIAALNSTPVWSVDGVARGAAQLVSQISGKPAFGGTPSDASIVEAIQELRARGKRITFYPFVMMDIAAGNVLPNPYSNGAAGVGQPIYPWRGRITCSPAAGFTGSVDKTATAATQIASFFGAATAAEFSVSGTVVTYTGPGTEWGYRRMVLHYAKLCAAAGGVDAFLIGSELRGLTTIRAAGNTYSAVDALITLAADVRAILGAGTKISYGADWTEYFGHQPSDGTGDVYFHLDKFWANANVDFVGVDNYVPLSDWRDGFSHADALIAPSIYDLVYLNSNILGGEGYDWFYANSTDRTNQTRTAIADGFGSPWVFRVKDFKSWWLNTHNHRPSGTPGAASLWVPQSKPIRFTELGCPAIDRGTNQPNVFFDPKSSESLTPYHSRGWRDDAIQRAYLEATFGFWGDAAHNPISTLYAASMVSVANCAVWTWDARPYPFFPQASDIWSDGPNWRLGHWLTGRLGAVSLAALVRHLCLRAGLVEDRIDVAGLWGAVEGYVITALESPRASISMLAQHFGFDAVESEGRIRFIMRGNGVVATITPDAMVAASGQGDVMELTRAQETELPQALKWQLARADADYDAVLVEAQRITVSASRVASESFAVAVPPEEAERRCRRALMETWAGRESAVFKLPPSRLALDACDVVALDHDGRLTEFRLISVGDNGIRSIEARHQDRAVYDLPPGTARAASLSRPVSFGVPEVLFLELPQLTDSSPAHQPLIAADAQPWPGTLAVFRSPAMDGFTLLTTFTQRAQIGVLAADFYAGPVSRFDLGNALVVDLASGVMQSVTDIALFGGANVLAVEAAPGQWEIVQAGSAELVAPSRYRLTRLLRGQRGTELTMANPALAGSRVVILDTAIAALPVVQSEIGLPWNWRVGPASRPVSDANYAEAVFTPAGIGLRPFSVAQVEQPWRTARSSGDLTISWIRRSRALAADSWEAAEVPLSEDSEAYVVEILDGITVKRILATSTASVLYAAAQQIADWGALLGPGSSLDIRICQLSALIGRGAVRSVTLAF